MSEEYKHTSEPDVSFNLPESTPAIIKVIGVGGGGGNAVNHMYREGIHDVSFALCNTDRQALDDSPVPFKLQLGKEGLGAGNDPVKARDKAEESIEEIRRMLDDGNTRMVFVTAGMGGGTGTGAAPIIARESKKMGILTVGIVTIPFRFEGNVKIDQALDGVEEIAREVDALLVINNERLREIYPDLTILSAFGKADDTLSIAARSIAEIITTRGTINIDFNDVCMALKDGGVAIISTGYGEGENRVHTAIQDALHSPLLNNNDIFNSKKVLLSISFSAEKEGEMLMMDEMNEVNDFMSHFSPNVVTKWGLSTDSSLGKKVKVTVLASGFGVNTLPGMEEKHMAEIAARTEEEDEKTEKNNIRRGKFYQSGNEPTATKHRYKTYQFSTDDLDNDNIIAMVETTPTFKRSLEVLNSIKSKSTGLDDAVVDNGNSNGPTPIVFS